MEHGKRMSHNIQVGEGHQKGHSAAGRSFSARRCGGGASLQRSEETQLVGFLYILEEEKFSCE